jgi:hypothetical protein
LICSVPRSKNSTVKSLRRPQETHQWMNPKPESESRATCGIDVIGLDLPHSLIGNIIFRCSKGNKEIKYRELHLQTHLCRFIYYTIYRMAMNTKVFLVAIAIVAAVATFAIATIASNDMLSGLGSFSGLGPTEVFAQNMTNMTGGNMTNMTG